jgi:hypothetical protein
MKCSPWTHDHANVEHGAHITPDRAVEYVGSTGWGGGWGGGGFQHPDPVPFALAAGGRGAGDEEGEVCLEYK